MGFRYYYAPLFEGNAPSDFDTSTDPPTEYPGPYVREPGCDSGSGVEYIPAKPPGWSNLMRDDAESRVVVKMHDHVAPCLGWVEKTSGEVLTDYPDLPGVE